MHTPYETKSGHPADFRVRYRFYSQEEGGRLHLPYQGYRSDFWYDYVGGSDNQIFMIWPEFENVAGEIIMQNDCPVSISGTARMWIIVPQRRPFHYKNIKPGMIGYFMEGGRKVAEAEVVELVGLPSNPTVSSR